MFIKKKGESQIGHTKIQSKKQRTPKKRQKNQ